MPWYYHAPRTGATTSGTPGTETAADMKFVSGTALNDRVTSVTINSRSPSGTSLAGAAINWKRAATPGAAGSAYTPNKANPNNPAAIVTITTTGTVGTTLTTQRTVGCAAPGGAGGWMAIEPSDAMIMLPGGGANGNLEVSTIAGLASIVIDYTSDFNED